MGPLNGMGIRLALVCVLSAGAVGCTSSTPASGQLPSPSGPITPVLATGSLTPMPTAPTPVVKGCVTGTVLITFAGYQANDSTICMRPGARLRLTIVDDGYGSVAPLQVTPENAATVASTTDSATGNVHAIVTPARTAPFCLTAVLNPTTPTPPVLGWRLCVTVRR